MEKYYYILDEIIKEELDAGNKIAIYPFGKIGMYAKAILEDRYGQKGIFIDNFLTKYNPEIIDMRSFAEKDYTNVTVILCAADVNLNLSLLQQMTELCFGVKVRNILTPIELMPPKAPLIIQNDEKKDFFQELKNLCCVKKVIGYDLVRVGKNYDGGYVMIDDFSKKSIAYSFGISNDISWEEWVASRYIDVYCYDHTIEGLPHRNEKLHWYKYGIAGTDRIEDSLLSMETLIEKNNHEAETKMILKMDVEGAEWEFIKSADSTLLDNFSQMTFELHYITDENHKEEIIAALRKINKTHQAVWIHANNGGGAERAKNEIVPNLLEITYVNKKEYQFISAPYDCPIELDYPNKKMIYDIELKGLGEVNG